MLDDHAPFADIEEAQGVFDTWRANTTSSGRISPWTWPLRPAASCPRPETVADLVLPAELAIVDGDDRVIRARDEPEHFVPTSPDAARRRSRGRRVHPGGARRAGNLSISEQQVWIGPKCGRTRGRDLGRHRLGARLLGRAAPQDRAVEAHAPTPCTASHAKAPSEGGPPPRARRPRDCGPPMPPWSSSAPSTAPGWWRSATTSSVSAIDLRRRTGAHRLRRRRRPRRARRGRGALLRLRPRPRPSASVSKGPGWPRRQSTCAPSLVVARRVSPSGVITVGGQRVVVGSAHRRKIVEVLVEQRDTSASWTKGPQSRPWPATPPRR